MKLVALTALLSVLLISSTVYFIVEQSKTELINFPGRSEGEKCLNIVTKQVGHAYIVFEVYAQNVCQKPKKFTILYKDYPTLPTTTYTTQCLLEKDEELTNLIHQHSQILSEIEEDC